MCSPIQCPKCKLYTWTGCGKHKEQVMAQIPLHQRCTCNKSQLDTAPVVTSSAVCNNNPTNGNRLRLLYALSGHSERVWCCAWSPNKSLLATTSGDKTIKLWAQSALTNTLECVQTLDAHTRTVRSVAWHPSSNLFCSASFDGTIGIWKKSENEMNTFEFECIDLLEGHDNEVKSVSWDCSGTLLASCSRDKSVWIWEWNEADGMDEFEVVAVKRSHDADVKCVRWHPFEPFLVSASYDDTIKTYKCDDFEDDWFVNQVLKKHKSTVWSIAFNPLDGGQFVTCSDDQSLVIWDKMRINENVDQETGDLVNFDELAYKIKQCIDEAHDEAIYSVDWLCHKQDGINCIATCSGDNDIKLFHQNQDKEWQLWMEQPNAHKNDVNWIEFGPRIKPGVYLIASASDDGFIKIWQLETPVSASLESDLDENYNEIVNEID